MNYDTFRDLYDMEFHGTTYTVVLNLHQYHNKETGEGCIKAEVYDPKDEQLKTLRAPMAEFRFRKKKATCRTCDYYSKEYCYKFETGKNKDDEACKNYAE